MHIKKERIQNNLHNTSILNQRLFKKINIDTNESKSKNNTIIKCSNPNSNLIIKNRIKNNKLFISSQTNPLLNNKNINIKLLNNSISKN